VLSNLLSEITLLFDLSLDLQLPLARRKAKSKVKVTHCLTMIKPVKQTISITQTPVKPLTL